MVFKTADVVKAEGGVGFGQKGLMMELQSLQEALKVEIQIHQKLVAQMKHDPQNAELKLQLHDLQAKITLLSERQKKVVEQLRRDLLVKQDSAEIRLQTYTQLPLQADGKTTTMVSSQSQNCLPPPHLNTPQNSVSVTPVIATKTLPLMLRAATPTTPIAMLPTPTIAMVTTLTNTPRPSLPNSDTQSSSISLQAAGKPANQGTEPVRIVPKNTIVVMPKTSVAPAALQPILASSQQPVLLTAKLSSALLPSSGPVHQLHIFNTQPGTTSAQAGTKTTQPCPNNAQSGFNIIQPCPSITMTLSTNLTQFNTSSTQHTTQLPSILISAPSNKPHTASPAQANTDLLPANIDTPHTAQNIVPCQDTLPTTSAVSTLVPKTSDNNTTTCPDPQQSSASPSSTATIHFHSNTHNPVASRTPTPKCPDNPLKLAFMLSLGLVTQDYLDEIQNKRQERKRRTTANPIYNGAVFEPERKKSTVSYLSSANQGCRKRGRPPKPSSAVEWGNSPLTPTILHSACVGPHSPAFLQSFSSHPSPSSLHLSPNAVGDGDFHDDFCEVCRHSGQLLMCDTCSRFYHQDCLAPPLYTVPRGMWICPSCQMQILKTDEAIEWPGTLAIVHSYISYKAEKEQEKLRLEKWSSDLQQERQELELRAKQLSDSITVCIDSRNGVLARQREMEASIEKMKSLVHLISNIQLPTLPQFIPRGNSSANPGFGSTQQSNTTHSSDENQCPNRKMSTSFGYSADVGSTSTDLRHSAAINTNTNIPSPKNAEDTTDTMNTSTSWCGPATNNSPAHSNTRKQNSMNSSSNGRLVPEEESKHQNSINDVNKSSTGDINITSIRDLKGTAEPMLSTIMPIPEVVHSLK